MQKAFIAIALALTLSCVAATYTVTEAGWVKKPVQILQDGDLNFTNITTTLSLGGLTASDVNVIAYNKATPVDKNTSFGTWKIFTKVIATKDLSSSSNTSYGFTSPLTTTFYSQGYAVGTDTSNETGIYQIYLYQTKLEGAATLPRVQLSSNTNKDITPVLRGKAQSGKTLMGFIEYNKTINGTSVTIGTSTLGKEFTFTTSNTASITAETGEAIASSQVYAGYKEGNDYKVAVVDFSSGTIVVAIAAISGATNMSCNPYVTDKKYYGVWCSNKTTSDDEKTSNTTIFVTSTNTTVYPLFTYNSTAVTVDSHFPYAGYLGFWSTDSNNASLPILSHEIWDLEGVKTFQNRTVYLSYETATAQQTKYRIPGAGIYGLVYNVNTTSNKTNVQVGLILAGSSLTTVFGFLMTIVAGLFLF